MSGQIDNKSLGTKVALRRWLLSRLGLPRVRVLDVCTGAGHIWTAMREHVEVVNWTRCDQKVRVGMHNQGILQMEASQSMRVLPLAEYDIIDIDTYGDPWDAYRIALERMTTRTGVLITHGYHMGVKKTTITGAGIPGDWPVPHTPDLGAYVSLVALQKTWSYMDIESAAEVMLPRGQGQVTVQYYGLVLRPKIT